MRPALPIRELESTSATSPSRSASLISKRKSAKKSRPFLRVEADEPAAAELAGDAVDQRPWNMSGCEQRNVPSVAAAIGDVKHSSVGRFGAVRLP